jgi:hypothetical protein
MSKINIYSTKEIRALSFICYCNWLSLAHTDMTFVSIKGGGGGGGTKRRKCVSNRAIKRRRGLRIEKCNSSFVGNCAGCTYILHCGICDGMDLRAKERKEGWECGRQASKPPIPASRSKSDPPAHIHTTIHSILEFFTAADCESENP